MTLRRTLATALCGLVLAACTSDDDTAGTRSPDSSTTSTSIRADERAPVDIPAAPPEQTNSGRAPVGDESWFEDGLFGSYGVSGEYVYGAVEACTDFFAGAGTHRFLLVDGDTNALLRLDVHWDTESDVADFVFTRESDDEPFFTELAPYDLRNVDDAQHFAATFSDGTSADLQVPTSGACAG